MFAMLPCTTKAVESIEHAFKQSVVRRRILCCRGLPGHRKHTNDTKINCDSGEAYQGRAMDPSFKLLYFHPLGILTSPGSTE